jgi:3-deoxy-D-manno-octulosonic-acid transferase
MGLTGRLLSAGVAATNGEVMIVDAMGKLAALYELAEVAFVGGSLIDKGGQNPIEAAAAGKPVAFGRDMSDFPDVAAELLEVEAAQQVGNAEQLLASTRQLLANPDMGRSMGLRGRRWVESHRGVTGRVADQIMERLDRLDR